MPHKTGQRDQQRDALQNISPSKSSSDRTLATPCTGALIPRSPENDDAAIMPAAHIPHILPIVHVLTGWVSQ